MLVDSGPRPAAPVSPPPPPPVERPSLARGTEQSTAQSLQQRAEAGQILSPVEHGTLARLIDSAALLPTADGIFTWGRLPLPDGGATYTPEPKQHLTDAQVHDESQRILDVGDRGWRKDDYDARLKAYAETMGKLDDSSRDALLRQIMKDDGGATNSWLQGGRLIALRDKGEIAYTDAGAVVDAFADSYLAGNAGSAYAAIDFLGGSSLTSLGATVPDQMKTLTAMLDAGSPAKMDQLREALGRELLKTFVTPDPNFAPQNKQAQLALQIMGGANDPSMAGRVYGSFDAPQRDAIYGAAANFAPFNNRPDADPLQILVNSVSAAGTDGATAPSGDQWSDIETELVRQANSTETGVSKSPLFWDSTSVIPGRAEAYSNLLAAHGDVILDQMTDPRDQQVDPTAGDPSTTYVVSDGRALANLMRATVLAPDNPAHQRANDAITAYVAKQHAALGDGSKVTTAGEQAIDRLARLGAAAQFAGEQLSGDLLADQQAKQQLIGFCADIALAAVPLGSKISGAATKALEDTFGSGVVAKAAQNATGALIDQATGKLTEEGKQALFAALSDEGKSVVNNIEAANLVKSAIFAGVGRDNIYHYDLNQNMQDDVTALR